MFESVLKNIFIISLFFFISCTCDSESKENEENMKTKAPQSVSQVRKQQKSSSREEIRKEVYARPTSFPKKALEILYNGETIRKEPHLITEKKFKKLFDPLDKLTALENTDEEKVDAVVKTHGFSGASEYFSQLLSVMSCIDAVKILAKLEEMHTEAVKEGKKPEHSQIYKSYFEMSKSLISRAGVSEKDIRFVYDNWNKALELKDASRKIRFNK